MEIRQLQYFLSVAEEKNITKAAEKLHISQPPLSKQMKELENELKAQLFIRKSHGIELTEAGILFKQYALRIMELVGAANDQLHKLSAGLQGTIHLASVEGYAPKFLSKLIADFHKLYPLIEFELWNGNSDDVSMRVSRGLSDLGIIMEPYNSECFKAVKIYEEPWIAIIPSSYPIAKKTGNTISIKELASYELIIPSRGIRLQQITELFHEIGETPRIYCRMAHMLNAYELSSHGAGISIFPSSAASYLSTDKVCIKKLIEPEILGSYLLITNPARTLSLAAQEFFHFVMSNIKAP